MSMGAGASAAAAAPNDPATSPLPASPVPANILPASTPAAPPLAPAAQNTPEDYAFQEGLVCPICKLTPQFPEGRSGLHWHSHWRSVGVQEYVTVGALGLAALGVELFWSSPTSARWDDAILFDDPVRNLLRIDSASGREKASTLSDILIFWQIVHPTLIDPLLVAWWHRKSPYVAWQMIVIDAQAYTLTLLTTGLVKRLAARARPWVGEDDCAGDATSEACGHQGPHVSFYSGHAAVTATGAGLLCAHHTQLSLYQDDWLDTGTCAAAVVGTALTGAMRIAADEHWATDVLVGHLVGYASGYLLPTLLYYKEFRSAPHEHPEAAPTYTAMPLLTPNALGLQVLGSF
jgi:membrane-associated phospholipid phosphatase